jgi:hypothetical protein
MTVFAEDDKAKSGILANVKVTKPFLVSTKPFPEQNGSMSLGEREVFGIEGSRSEGSKDSTGFGTGGAFNARSTSALDGDSEGEAVMTLTLILPTESSFLPSATRTLAETDAETIAPETPMTTPA